MVDWCVLSYGGALADGMAKPTLSHSIQQAFDAISDDIDDKRQIVEEYNSWLDLVKEYE